MGFCLLLLVYAFTSSRDLYWFDSAELALAGLQNGLGHPPGQPLYTWLLHAGAAGGGKPLVWMNFVSNLAGALCVLPASSIAWTLLGRGRREGFLVTTAVAVLVAGAGLIPQLWESSARVEVYSVAGFIGLMQVALLLPVLDGEKTPGSGFWLVQGLLLGLVGSVNPVLMLIQAAASFVAVAAALLRRALRPSPSMALAAAGIAAGLLPYVHVVAVAASTDRFTWGAPETLASFAAYITGKDYARNLGASPGEVVAHMGVFAAWSVRRGMGVLLAAGILGWALLALRRSGLIVFLACLLLSLVWVCMNKPYFPEVPDFYDYLFTSNWLIMAGAVALLMAGLRRIEGRSVRAVLLPAAAGLWIVSLALLPPALWKRARTSNTVPRQMAQAILDEAPENAIVITGSDHLFFPLFYLTEGEGERRDVVLVNPGWASSSWYWKLLYRRHPDLETFDLDAPNRWVRLENFLLANHDREVLAENLSYGTLSGRMPCMGGWLVWTDRMCLDDGNGRRAAARRAAIEALRGWAASLGRRWTIDERVLAYVGASWGHDEMAMGKLKDAVRSYLAGAGMAGEGPAAAVEDMTLYRPPPASGFILLSTPARNVAYASHLVELFDPGLARKLYDLSVALRY
jgi:hypothetical protein